MAADRDDCAAAGQPTDLKGIHPTATPQWQVEAASDATTCVQQRQGANEPDCGTSSITARENCSHQQVFAVLQNGKILTASSGG